MLDAAINGTLYVMEGAHKHGARRVVVTASSVTVVDPCVDKPEFDESDWVKVRSSTDTYNKSKIKAELTAWEYVASMPESERFELITTHPSFIIGPLLIPGTSVGEKIFTQMLTGGFSVVP